MTLDELASGYGAGAFGFAALQAELDRRDRSERARAASRKRWGGWHDAAYAQYLAAEQACHGYLIGPAGKRAGIGDPIRLWYGSAERALRLASEELREFWLASPRVSPAQWAAQERASREAEREAERAPVIPSTADLAADMAAGAPRQAPAIAPGAAARYTRALGGVAAMAEAMAARLATQHTQIVRRTA
jgi:hypothetical protein